MRVGNIVGLICVILLLFYVSAKSDQSVTIAWDSNQETNIVGYRVYYGESSRSYQNVTNVGNATTATIHGLAEGRLYFFALTAVNSEGLESYFSDEISNEPPWIPTYVTLYLQEATMIRGPWTNVWAIDRAIDRSMPDTTYFYRLSVSLPPVTNILSSTNPIIIDTNSVPPLPP